MKYELMRNEEAYFRCIEKNIGKQQAQGNYPYYLHFPSGIQLELTSGCNLKCLHCYNDSAADQCEPDRMTGDHWMGLAEEIIREGGAFEVILSGGEPLLAGDLLFELMDIFERDGACITVISNGYLLDEKKAEAFTKFKNLTLRLSIDGFSEELHDYMRQVPGSFKRVTKAARLLAGLKVPFEISSCVTPFNINSMDRMAELALELGARNLGFDSLGLSGRAAKNRQLILDPVQMGEYYENLTRLAERYKFIKPAATGYFIALCLRSSLPKKSIIIRPDGDVRLSCLAPFVIGNVLEESLKKIWQSRGVFAWEHPMAVKFLENVDVVSGEFSGAVNYLDKDIRLDCEKGLELKIPDSGKNFGLHYAPPTVLPYIIKHEGTPSPWKIHSSSGSLFLDARPRGVAVKAREDGDYLIAASGSSIYFMNHTGRMAYLLMDGRRTLNEIISEVSLKYNADSSVVTAQAVDFCRNLQEFQLIKVED